MENKKEIIKKTIKEFTKVASKYCLSEEFPIRVNEETIVSTKEVHMIQAVGDNENIGVTDLGKIFGISKSAASQMVSKLSSRGFMKKMRSDYNNKEVKIELTKLGQEAYEAHDKHHSKDLGYLISKMETFSLSQIATLGVMLESLDEIMDERIKRYSLNKDR